MGSRLSSARSCICQWSPWQLRPSGWVQVHCWQSRSACWLVPVHPQDGYLLGVEWEGRHYYAQPRKSLAPLRMLCKGVSRVPADSRAVCAELGCLLLPNNLRAPHLPQHRARYSGRRHAPPGGQVVLLRLPIPPVPEAAGHGLEPAGSNWSCPRRHGPTISPSLRGSWPRQYETSSGGARIQWLCDNKAAVHAVSRRSCRYQAMMHLTVASFLGRMVWFRGRTRTPVLQGELDRCLSFSALCFGSGAPLFPPCSKPSRRRALRQQHPDVAAVRHAQFIVDTLNRGSCRPCHADVC